ncbi:hypothetical protein BDK51DRAFT_47375 [Blyttiomyces helicus]|uniref:Uncharacterized protein n=1 Tax=Blyttiomyces helicus TaxID=388810 RepID=A0A4P9W433_9FUNG|nr:hypothetical protein BDK51DRAFT_47375 [Blyttiomyces helicus]|eukprot:RKO87099.1 hypothetical protein BDK51DRAFT_47375 [Blyttiomyces helicus]
MPDEIEDTAAASLAQSFRLPELVRAKITLGRNGAAPVAGALALKKRLRRGSSRRLSSRRRGWGSGSIANTRLPSAPEHPSGSRPSISVLSSQKNATSNPTRAHTAPQTADYLPVPRRGFTTTYPSDMKPVPPPASSAHDTQFISASPAPRTAMATASSQDPYRALVAKAEERKTCRAVLPEEVVRRMSSSDEEKLKETLTKIEERTHTELQRSTTILVLAPSEGALKIVLKVLDLYMISLKRELNSPGRDTATDEQPAPASVSISGPSPSAQARASASAHSASARKVIPAPMHEQQTASPKSAIKLLVEYVITKRWAMKTESSSDHSGLTCRYTTRSSRSRLRCLRGIWRKRKRQRLPSTHTHVAMPPRATVWRLFSGGVPSASLPDPSYPAQRAALSTSYVQQHALHSNSGGPPPGLTRPTMYQSYPGPPLRFPPTHKAPLNTPDSLTHWVWGTCIVSQSQPPQLMHQEQRQQYQQQYTEQLPYQFPQQFHPQQYQQDRQSRQPRDPQQWHQQHQQQIQARPSSNRTSTLPRPFTSGPPSTRSRPNTRTRRRRRPQRARLLSVATPVPVLPEDSPAGRDTAAAVLHGVHPPGPGAAAPAAAAERHGSQRSMMATTERSRDPSLPFAHCLRFFSIPICLPLVPGQIDEASLPRSPASRPRLPGRLSARIRRLHKHILLIIVPVLGSVPTLAIGFKEIHLRKEGYAQLAHIRAPNRLKMCQRQFCYTFQVFLRAVDASQCSGQNELDSAAFRRVF